MCARKLLYTLVYCFYFYLGFSFLLLLRQAIKLERHFNGRMAILANSGFSFLPLFPRVQRCAMLQFSEFHEKLFTTLCKKTEDGLTTEHAQSLVLDTLCWLAGVYSNGPGR